MNKTEIWYSSLKKPFWSPPAWLFGPVWTVLYIIIVITFGYVYFMYLKKKVSTKILKPFILNLIFNFIFTPLQFGLRNNYLAALDILFCLFTLIWAIIIIWPKYKWVALSNLPYLLWVSFATFLQLSITYLNR